MRFKVSFLTVIFLLLSVCFCGCTKNNDSTNVVSNNSQAEEIKCVAYVPEGDEWVVEGEQANNLYKYICENFKSSEKSDWYYAKSSVNPKTDYICLSFQTGTPLMISDDETVSTKVYNFDDFEMFEGEFFGTFRVYVDDYVLYTETPVTSHNEIYIFPDGTYRTIQDMLNN